MASKNSENHYQPQAENNFIWITNILNINYLISTMQSLILINIMKTRLKMKKKKKTSYESQFWF